MRLYRWRIVGVSAADPRGPGRAASGACLLSLGCYLRVHRWRGSVATAKGGRDNRLQLNVYISSAADGIFTVKAVQMQELSAHARTLEDVPGAVRSAAAALTGESPEEFDLVLDF